MRSRKISYSLEWPQISKCTEYFDHSKHIVYIPTTNEEIINIFGKVRKLYSLSHVQADKFTYIFSKFLTYRISFPFPKVILVDITDFNQSSTPSSEHDLILVTKTNAYATKLSPFPLELHRGKK